MLRRLIIFLVILSGLVGIGRADDATPGDRAAMQQVIADQISAFLADDGKRAYEFASPTIQNMFPTPELFMSMVRNGYPQVYRPQRYRFGTTGTSPVDGLPSQHVTILGPDGKTYDAVYTLQRQPDGSWKINSCTIAELPAFNA